MRYAGQNYEHLVPIAAENLSDANLETAFQTFTRIHEERYGYAIAGEEIELVAFHVTLTGRRARPRLAAPLAEAAVTDPPRRPIHFRGVGELEATVYRRYALPAGTTVAGPAIIEEPGSTILVEPGMSAEVLPDGQIVIETGVGGA
jgi:N-methylhydantoinase A